MCPAATTFRTAPEGGGTIGALRGITWRNQSDTGMQYTRGGQWRGGDGKSERKGKSDAGKPRASRGPGEKSSALPIGASGSLGASEIGRGRLQAGGKGRVQPDLPPQGGILRPIWVRLKNQKRCINFFRTSIFGSRDPPPQPGGHLLPNPTQPNPTPQRGVGGSWVGPDRGGGEGQVDHRQLDGCQPYCFPLSPIPSMVINPRAFRKAEATPRGGG